MRVLVGTPVVERLSLEPVFERVLEGARVEQSEGREETVARLRQPGQVMVVRQLEEIAVLPQVSGARHGVVERVVRVADAFATDADRGVAAEAEADLAALVQGQGEGRASAD